MKQLNKKYRTPSFDEMVVGFKCQTCYCMFTETDEEDEWVDIEFTEKNCEEFVSVIRADAYKTEFRVLIEKTKKK